MNDAELIALLRKRVSVLELGIERFQAADEAIGLQRMAAYEAMRAGRYKRYAAFFGVYERTMPERLAAHTALHEALVTDFRTALASDPDLTEAQRAEWLGKTEASTA